MSEEKPVILVVEDDLDVAEMLGAYFNIQGYDVRSVNWGEDAVRTAQTNPPDLVILDIRLPDIDGFEVAYRLRNSRRTKDVPIIFLTERRARSDRLQGLELGADDYITKPFDIQELRLRVRNALRRAKQGTLTNPVTNLPDGILVDERLEECLKNTDWAIILISLVNLEYFREAYGFVAADDVLRAVNLMIHNAVREVGGVNDFVGHSTPNDFILITTFLHLTGLVDRIHNRTEQSLDYFYPLRDRERKSMNEGRLSIRIQNLLGTEGTYPDLKALKSKIIELIT